MPALLPLSIEGGKKLLPARQLISIDAGSHCVKILFLETFFGRTRILHQQMIDLQEEDLLSPEELGRHLRAILREFGPFPVALNVSQHLSISQIIDLPAAHPEGVRALIEEETRKLSGLTESAIVYDYSKLEPFGNHANPYWVTFAQEGEVVSQIDRLGLEHDELCEVTSSANALVTAYQSLHPDSGSVLLVDLGATMTAAAILVGGQALFAGSFPIGGDLFTENLASLNNSSFDAADTLKRSKNLLDGPDADLGFRRVVEGWYVELERLLRDWLEENAELELSFQSFEIVLAGGAALQPGLVQFLRTRSTLNCSLWPGQRPGKLGIPVPEFAVAFGAALHALKRAAQSASLLPTAIRQTWQKQRRFEQLQSANLILLLVVALTLILGTWQKITLLNYKRALYEEAQAVLQNEQTVAALTLKIDQQYERLRPVVQRQLQTVQTLETLQLLQQVRSNQNFWFVLFADQQSYVNAPLPPPPSAPAINAVASTNQPPVTNAPVRPPEPALPAPNPSLLLAGPAPAKPGFVAEICLPEEGEALRQHLQRIVADLNRADLFRKVDALPQDSRRPLAFPPVLLTNKHFAIELDLKNSDLLQPNFPPGRAGAAQPLPQPASFRDRSERLRHNTAP